MLWSQSTISTFGGRDWFFPGADKSAVEAPIGSFLTMATGSGSRIVFVDPGNRQILEIDPQGIVRVVAGNGEGGTSPDGTPARQAKLSLGGGIAFDPAGRLVFTDGGLLRYIDSDGTLRTLVNFGQLVDPLRPRGANAASYLKYDSAGKLYILSSFTILRLDSPTELVIVLGGGDIPNAADGNAATSLKTNSLTPFDFDAEGRVVFADVIACRVRRINADGKLETLAGTQSCSLSPDGSIARQVSVSPGYAGVRIAPDGRILFPDHGFIRAIGPTGSLETLAGPRGSTTSPQIESPFLAPGSMELLKDGRLIVEDLTTQRIYSVGGGLFRQIGGDGCFMPPDPRPISALNIYINAGPFVAPDGKGGLFANTVDPRSVFRISPDGISRLTYGQTATNCKALGSVPNIPPASPGPLFTQVDSDGVTYYMELNGVTLYRINPDGGTTPIAGATGNPSNAGIDFSGDGGPANQAIMRAAPQFWLSPEKEFWIADKKNHRIRRVDRNGIIRTVAGNGTAGYSGDGGSGIDAKLNQPTAVMGDGRGNVYFSDSLNHVVRRLDANGTITTIAGDGKQGFAGDGGPATQSRLSYPQGLWVDSRRGEIFIAELAGNRVRRIDAAGVITTVAGNGNAGFSGDGGPATEASLNAPMSVMVDAADYLYIGDTNNRRIRRVLLDRPLPAGAECGVALSKEAVSLPGAGGTGRALLLARGDCEVGSDSGAEWLSITSGATGRGSREILFNAAPNESGRPRSAALRFANRSITIQQAAKPALVVEPAAIQLTGIAGQDFGSRILRVGLGTGASPVTVSLTNTTDREDWLSVSEASGTVDPAAPLERVITLATAKISPGTYRGNIAVYSSATGERIDVPVTITLSALTQALQPSYSGLTFRAALNGASQTQTVLIGNPGQASLTWAAKASTLSGGNWLSVTPASGVSSSSAAPAQVAITANPAGLAAGEYYGTVELTAPSIASTYTLTISLAVGVSDATLGPYLDSANLLFRGAPNGPNPAAQTLVIVNPGRSALPFSAALEFGGKPAWLTVTPSSGSVPPGQQLALTLQPVSTSLAAGVTTADIVLTSASLGSPLRTTAQLLLAPGLTSAGTGAAPGCAATRLLPQLQSPGSGFTGQAGWAVPIRASISDDCGAALTSGDVVASIIPGEAPTRLRHVGSGIWTGTWTARQTSASMLAFTVRATSADTSLRTGSTTGSVAIAPSSSNPPVIAKYGVLNAASLALQGPLAPGAFASVFGANLSNSLLQAGEVPLPSQLDSTSAAIAGRPAPLYFVSANQVNLQVPFEVSAETEQWVTLRRGNTLSVPEPILVASAAPALFSVDASGSGQGHIYRFEPDGTPSLASAASGAKVGDVLVAYASGLGITTPLVASGAASPIPAATVKGNLTITVANRPATILFAGLAPNFVGLYQINFVVPQGLPPGVSLPVELTVNGVRAPIVSLNMNAIQTGK